MYRMEALVDMTNGIAPLWFALLAVAAFFGAAVNAAFGLGGGLFSLAVIASTLPIGAVIPIHAATMIGSSASRALLLRKFWHLPTIALYSIGGALGVAVAASVVITLPLTALQLILAAFILVSLVTPTLTRVQASLLAFLPIGFVTAFASMFVGATTPLLACFFDARTHGRHRLVGTLSGCVAVLNSFKVIAFINIGFAFQPWLPLIAALMVATTLGSYFGKRLLDRLPEKHFQRAFRLILALLALRLAWLGIASHVIPE